MPLAARRPWVAILLWVAVLLVAVPLVPAVAQHLSAGGFSAPHSAAQAADATTAHLHAPASAAGAEPATLVQGLARSRMMVLARGAGLGPRALAPSGASAVVLLPGAPHGAAHRFLNTVRAAGARVTPINASTESHAVSGQAIAALKASTVVAVPALVILLALVFGAVMPAVLPLVAAGVGTALTLGVVSVLERFLPLSVYLLQIVTFLALGVGVDYVLFVTSRFRTELDRGAAVDGALATAMRTGGRSVLFSGIAVSLALGALLLGGTAYWTGMALGGALAVASVLLVTHTLLPALLRLLGPHIHRGRIRWAMPDWPLWARLADWATSQPLGALGLGLLVLVGLGWAAPSLSANVPANVARMLPVHSPLAEASRVLQRIDGAGSVAPMVVALRLKPSVAVPASWTTVAHVTAVLAQLRDVAAVASPTGHTAPPVLARLAARGALSAFVAGSHRVDLFVTARSGPDTARTATLLQQMSARLGRVAGAQAEIGGPAAVMQGFDHYLAGRLPWMAAAVVLVALGVLWAATGSPLQALLGVSINGLVMLATAGVLVAIIQRGAFGIAPNPLNLAVLPLVFVMLFGLSMDYQVILLHRIQEQLARGLAPRAAARQAAATTGGLITGAGLIMVAVVAALVASPFEVLQTLGIGLATAVLVDTLVVRTCMVPALVTVLGPRAFWPRRAGPAA